MQVFVFPFVDGRFRKRSSITAEKFTVAWVVEVIAHMGGSCTIREACERLGLAEKDHAKATKAFEKSFNEGMIECHYTNAGKRGRPRYEFRVSES